MPATPATPTPAPTPPPAPAPPPTWTAAQITAPLRAASPRFKACYVGETYFRSTFTLLADGSPRDITVLRVTGEETHPGCIAAVLASLRWPAIAGALDRKVEVPLTSAAW